VDRRPRRSSISKESRRANCFGWFLESQARTSEGEEVVRSLLLGSFVFIVFVPAVIILEWALLYVCVLMTLSRNAFCLSLSILCVYSLGWKKLVLQ